MIRQTARRARGFFAALVHARAQSVQRLDEALRSQR